MVGWEAFSAPLTSARGKSFGAKVSGALKASQPTIFRSSTGEFELCVAPFYFGKELVGAVVVDALLPQKKQGLTDTDIQLLSLLSAQAAPALSWSRKLARAEAQNQAVEQLLKAPAGSSGRPSMQGNLDDTKLIDVFQLISMTQKSGRLIVLDDAANAEFHFRGGSSFAVWADKAKIPLKDAPGLVCSWLERSGTFCFYSELPSGEPVESMSCDALVLDAFRLYDESKNSKQLELPPAEF